MGGLCLGVSVWGVSICGVSVQGGLCPGGLCLGSLSGVSVQGDLCLGRGSLSGGLCLGVSVQGGLSRGVCPGESLSGEGRGVSVRETPRMVTNGRYASYWNAFLFFIYFIIFPHNFITLKYLYSDGHTPDFLCDWNNFRKICVG